MRNIFFLLIGKAGFFIVLMLFNFERTAAETAKPFRVGASVGYSFTGYSEETYSPVNRYLNTITFILDGNIEKGNFFHSFNIGFLMGDSKISAEEVIIRQNYDPTTGEAFNYRDDPQYLAIRGYLEYALDYRLWGNDTFPGYLGGAFRGDTYLQFANYPSITGLVSLNVHASQKWVIDSKNVFTFSLGIPFFGYAVRPPYAGADAALIKYAAEQPMKIITMGEVISFHNYYAIFGDLKFQHAFTTLLSLYSGLGFELSRINFPRPRTDAILRLNSGIAFTF